MKKLTRSQNEKMIAGVCGGIAEYFDIDPTLVRLAFVLLFFVGGNGILIYLILWILMPAAESAVPASQAVVDAEPKDK
ncbi:MAG: PspC domain-containing protein [Anaerolineae bacterium]|nr:PspC domain-containing protein [Anaerolineae bacterium]